MSAIENDPRFDEAILLFNTQEFFACHDVLEEIWSETLSDKREFLQGLIHAAVSLFHLTEGNYGGARKMHDSTVRYLSPYRPACSGIELDEFLVQFDRCFEPILGTHQSYPTDVSVDESLIPNLVKVQ